MISKKEITEIILDFINYFDNYEKDFCNGLEECPEERDCLHHCLEKYLEKVMTE